MSQLTTRADPDLLKRVEAHREWMNKRRPEGAGLMTTSDAVRNLLLRGLAHEERERHVAQHSKEAR